jgi:hypothetical protein
VIFDYPIVQEHRRHGPEGYATYESYRSWLRDEFDFRCVYCLNRETWGRFESEFELDHFEPQALKPQSTLDYLNLVYACRRCNAAKGDRTVSDPMRKLRAPLVAALPDGTLTWSDRETQRLILQLDLNSPTLKAWRVMWLRVVALAEVHDRDLYFQLVGFPKELPDLTKLRPPRNTRKEGLADCWFARRQRGLLPASY